MPSVTAPPLVVLLLLLLTASFGASQARLDCGASQPSPSAPSPPPTPTTNSTVFRANLLALLDALPRAAAPTGFASLSLGTGHDRVFVRGLCRGDSSPTECLADLQVAVRNLSGSCTSSRRAAAWFDKCCITYADTNASTSYEEGFVQVVYDTRRVADPGSYEQTYYRLMRRLVVRAASDGGGNGSARMFATGEAEYACGDPNGTMYGLVQCMRDRSAADCGRCLEAAVPKLPTCCRGQQGGVARRYDCNLRIQIYPYYDLALDGHPATSGFCTTTASPLAVARRRKSRKWDIKT